MWWVCACRPTVYIIEKRESYFTMRTWITLSLSTNSYNKKIGNQMIWMVIIFNERNWQFRVACIQNCNIKNPFYMTRNIFSFLLWSVNCWGVYFSSCAKHLNLCSIWLLLFEMISFDCHFGGTPRTALRWYSICLPHKHKPNSRIKMCNSWAFYVTSRQTRTTVHMKGFTLCHLPLASSLSFSVRIRKIFWGHRKNMGTMKNARIGAKKK